MERQYFDHGEWDDGLQPQRQTAAQIQGQGQAQPTSAQQQAPAIVVAQRAPDSAYQTQNYQAPDYVDALPHQLRAAAQLVRTTNPRDIPSFPSLAAGVDRVASLVPWWLVLVLGVGAGYWVATKRHRGSAA